MEFLGHFFMIAYLGLVFLLSLYGLHRYWILYLYFRYYKWAPPLACPAMPLRRRASRFSFRFITNAMWRNA